MADRDRSGTLPFQLAFRFPRVGADGLPTAFGFQWEYFRLLYDIDDVELKRYFGHPSRLTIQMGATASGPGVTPTNAAALELLADKMADAHWGWLKHQFDESYTGIWRFEEEAFTDEIEWTLTQDACSTRRWSAPIDGQPTKFDQISLPEGGTYGCRGKQETCPPLIVKTPTGGIAGATDPDAPPSAVCEIQVFLGPDGWSDGGPATVYNLCAGAIPQNIKIQAKCVPGRNGEDGPAANYYWADLVSCSYPGGA